ncbi:MAG: AsmA family protein [Xanthomonadaceae bacterium]|nr:AsmA family protein [Xanthomonadaceae bacterium]
MKRPLKIIGIIFGTLLLVVIALAIALPLLFDINDYKDRIAAEVESETGRALTIDGDLHLTVFPWLGVRTGAMSLAQREGFDDAMPFASFSEADVRVRLLPLLLRREIELGRVSLAGLQLQLERDADGRDNWSDLLERDARTTDAPPPAEDGKPFEFDRLDIAGFTLAGARVAFRDVQAGTSYIVEDLNLTTGRIRVGERTDVEMDARITSGVPQWRGEVAFNGAASFDPESSAVSLIAERASADLQGGALPVERLRVVFSAQVDGNLESEAWQFRELQLDATARGGRLPDRDITASFGGAATANLSEQTLALRNFTFEGVGVRAELTADGTGIIDEPALTGRVTVEPFSPRAVLETLGRPVPETEDPTALTHLQFAADFSATENSVELRDMQARLDASRLTGRFAVADLEAQAMRFTLAVDQLDLDRYLAPDTPQAEAVPSGALDSIRIPVELVRGLDVEGTLSIGRMRVTGLASEQIEVGINARGGVLRVHPSSATMYGGRYTGDITLDASGAAPRLSMNERVVGVQAGPLFTDLFGEARITGTADLSARLTGTGETIGQLRPTLAGEVAFRFDDGAVQGFDLWHMVADARAVMRNETRPARSGAEETEFGRLSGTGTVRDGVMTTNDLRAQLPFMLVTGTGTMDLAQEEVDFRLQVAVQRVPGVDGSEGVGELGGRTVPFRIAGPLDDLSYRVDIAAALREEVRERVEERIDEERERLQERLRNRLLNRP